MGGDGLGDHHSVQREAVGIKADFSLDVANADFGLFNFDFTRFRVAGRQFDVQVCPAARALDVGIGDDLRLTLVVHVDDHGGLVVIDLADRDDHRYGDARLDLIAPCVVEGDVHQLNAADLHEVVCHALADFGEGVRIPYTAHRHRGALGESAFIRRHGHIDARGAGRKAGGGPADGSLGFRRRFVGLGFSSGFDLRQRFRFHR